MTRHMILCVSLTVLFVFGCVNNPQHAMPEPNQVIALGCDISKTMNIRNIPPMELRHLELLIDIVRGKGSAELAFTTIGSARYPQVEQVQVFNVLDFPLDRRGAIQQEQNARLARFKAKVGPRLSRREDNYTNLYNSLQLLATYLHQPRTTPVQKFLIVASDFQPDPTPVRNQQAKRGREETPVEKNPEQPVILLPPDVTVLVVCPERGAADPFFQQPVEYFVDMDGLLLFLQQILEKQS